MRHEKLDKIVKKNIWSLQFIALLKIELMSIIHLLQIALYQYIAKLFFLMND